MSTMGWPDPKAAGREFVGVLEAFNPSSTLCTAREIITLWVSRMVMFNRYFRGQDLGAGPGNGPLPYRDVFIHSVIQDGEGRKMSKMLGNGVDPLDIISSHGADAMRYTLVKLTTQTQDVRMPVQHDPATGKNSSAKFDEGRNFCNKLWNAARFAMGILEQSDGATKRRSDEGEVELALPDRWMLSRLAAGVDAVNAAIKGFEFSEYAQTVYDLLWRDFCDWYLEAIKPTVASDPRQRAVLARGLGTIVRLLHPIAPFVTEAIWDQLRHIETGPVEGVTLEATRVDGLLCTAGWPKVAGSLRDPVAEHEFERVRGLVTAIREVRAQHNVPPKKLVTLHLPRAVHDSVGPILALVRGFPSVAVGTVTTDPPSGAAAAFTFESAPCHLSDLAEAVDAGAEKVRLEKHASDLTRTIDMLKKRLANPGYAEKAPPAMVQQTRDQLAKAEAELAAATTAMRTGG
jgi:valyl-tRNA synthetase